MVEINSWSEYQVKALRTEKPDTWLNDNQVHSRLAHAVTGLFTEVGELQDQLKRHYIYKRPLDVVNLMEEASDIAWYAALAMNVLEKDIEEFETVPSLHFNAPPSCWQEERHPLQLAYRAGHEVGDLQGEADKLFWGPTHLRPQNLHKRISWVLAPVGWLLHQVGYTWKQTCERNIAKLLVRFPIEGKQDAATNRDLEAERKALEDKPDPLASLPSDDGEERLKHLRTLLKKRMITDAIFDQELEAIDARRRTTLEQVRLETKDIGILDLSQYTNPGDTKPARLVED